MVKDYPRAALLCLVGGSADAIAYLRFGTFVGAMSGNTVLLGIAVFQGQDGRALYHAAIIAVFLAAIVATHFALLDRVPVIVPLLSTAVMLAATELIAGRWSAALAAAALGMQNAAIRKFGGVAVNTVFITGDLERLGAAVPQSGAPRRRDEIALLAVAWIAYAIGAILGAAVLFLIRYPMLVPAALALVAAVVETYAGDADAQRR